MSQVVASFFFFGLFVLIHIISFRLKLVKFQTTAFVGLSLLCLAVYLFSIRMFPDFYGFGGSAKHALWGENLLVTSILLYGMLCLCYLNQSIVLQYGSPSMTIIDALWRQKKTGVSYGELKILFSNELLILSRLEDLVSHGLAKYENGRYYIQPRGSWVVGFIKAYRQLLGRPLGG